MGIYSNTKRKGSKTNCFRPLFFVLEHIFIAYDWQLHGSVLKKCVSPDFSYLCISKKTIKKMKLTHSQISEIISDYISCTVIPISHL